MTYPQDMELLGVVCEEAPAILNQEMHFLYRENIIGIFIMTITRAKKFTRAMRISKNSITTVRRIGFNIPHLLRLRLLIPKKQHQESMKKKRKQYLINIIMHRIPLLENHHQVYISRRTMAFLELTTQRILVALRSPISHPSPQGNRNKVKLSK